MSAEYLTNRRAAGDALVAVRDLDPDPLADWLLVGHHRPHSGENVDDPVDRREHYRSPPTATLPAERVVVVLCSVAARRLIDDIDRVQVVSKAGGGPEV